MSGEHARTHALVRRYGWNATAFQTLEAGYSYFFDEDACVAHVDTGGAWIAAGAPIVAPDRLAVVAQAFANLARKRGKRCAFFATEPRFQAASPGFRSLQIGEQAVWVPAAWAGTLARHASLREQLRRARAKGVRVRRLATAELESGPSCAAMQSVATQWLASRTMAPMGFLVRLEWSAYAAERRAFVAELDGRIVGFAGVIPVPARAGWFLEDLVRLPGAPNGTNELLIDAVMRWAAEQDSQWLTLGLAPLAGDVAPPLRFARRTAKYLYDFEGLRAFKSKLRPASWMPIYLSFPSGQGGFVSLLDAVGAFVTGGFLPFGARSLLQRMPSTRTCYSRYNELWDVSAWSSP
jgi:phosphatidylglycerol lysyltransferase